MSEHTIVIQDVSKRYGKIPALTGLSLTINQGMFGLLGRNGAGKTTLMRILATLQGKQSGNITVCGIPIENARAIRPLIGYLPQEFSMYPGMTVASALDYLGILSGMPAALRKLRMEELLGKVNLQAHRHKKIKALSGGMKRRLGIAQALLHNPRVLIVDEPTAGLDPEERIHFRNLLSEVAEERIVILSTHIAGDIESTCERIAVLDGGKLLFHGTIASLLEQASGHVFLADIARADLPGFKAAYAVIEAHAREGGSRVRFVAAAGKPTGIQAEAITPNIEDAYMFCLLQRGGKR